MPGDPPRACDVRANRLGQRGILKCKRFCCEIEISRHPRGGSGRGDGALCCQRKALHAGARHGGLQGDDICAPAVIFCVVVGGFDIQHAQGDVGSGQGHRPVPFRGLDLGFQFESQEGALPIKGKLSCKGCRCGLHLQLFQREGAISRRCALGRKRDIRAEKCLCLGQKQPGEIPRQFCREYRIARRGIRLGDAHDPFQVLCIPRPKIYLRLEI